VEGVLEVGRRRNIFVQSKEGGVFVACIISGNFFLVVCFLFIISTMFCFSFVNLSIGGNATR